MWGSMTRLARLKKQYSKVVRRLNKINKAYNNKVGPLYAEKNKLYGKIYELSAAPQKACLAAVEAKLTPLEKQHVRVLWNTPPDIGDLEEVWCETDSTLGRTP